MQDGTFPSTRRSIFEMVHADSEPLQRQAIGAIVEAYWKPAYKYVRLRWKQDAEQARELTQDFFASLLEREMVQRYDPSAGSFRTYLRTCIDGHVKNVWTAARREKRGGLNTILSLDFEGAESELSVAAADQSPEEVFYREWQREMFTQAIADLRQSCQPANRAVRFAVFEQYDLAGDPRPSYEQVAHNLGIPVTAVTNHLAWARRELRRSLLDRLEAITASRKELQKEAETLLGPE